MFKIDGANTVNALPARTAPGVAPGWFEQNPGAGAGTVLTGEWLNMVQAELLAVLTAAGVVPDKAVDTQIAAAIQALAGFRNVLDLSAAGLTNWVVPAGIVRVYARLWGPGGGCDLGTGSPSFIGSAGAGGGGYAAKLCVVVPGTTIPLTVGAKGVAGSPGTNGGTTSFGAVFSATGGARGIYNDGGAGGIPGNGVGGDINITGGRGGRCQNLPSHVVGGVGGGSPTGGAGGGLGVNGVWPGGGGGGSGAGDGQSHLAGDGADGRILLTW